MDKRKIFTAAFFVLMAGSVFFLRVGKTEKSSKSGAQVKSQGPELILELPWGSGGWNAGKKEAGESAPEGPMSFALSPAGDIYILDQVNFRVLKFYSDGMPASQIPISAAAFQDIEVSGSGKIILLDRLVGSCVVVMEPDGKEVSSWPVTGAGIAEGGGVTAMFLDKDGLWLEYNHGYMVRVLDDSLKACHRSVVPGRKLKTGSSVVAAAVEKPGKARVWTVHPGTGSKLGEKLFSFGQDVYRIAWIETDGSGAIHCMFHLVEWFDAANRTPPLEKVVVVKLDKNLKQKASFSSPYTIRAWEQFREFRVTGEGDVVQMAFTNGGVRLLRWRYGP